MVRILVFHRLVLLIFATSVAPRAQNRPQNAGGVVEGIGKSSAPATLAATPPPPKARMGRPLGRAGAPGVRQAIEGPGTRRGTGIRMGGRAGALWPPGPRVSGFQAASGVRGVAGPRVGEARNRLGGHQNWLLNVRFVGRGGRVLLQGSGMCEPGTPRGCGGSRPGGPGFPPPADGSFSPAGARLAGPRVPGGCHVPHGRRGRPGGY